LTPWRCPPHGNCVISRAGIVHRPGMAEFHAVESSIARESQNPRARVVPCPGIAEFHAVESSIARELENSTAGGSTTLGKRRNLSAGVVRPPIITEITAAEESN